MALVSAILLVGGLIVVELRGSGVMISGSEKLDQRLSPERVSIVDAARALDYGENEGKESLAATFGERFPGAVLVVSRGAPILGPHEARAVGRARVVNEVEGLRIVEPDTPAMIRGVGQFDMWRDWRLYAVDDRAAVFFVAEDDGDVIAADGRLVPDGAIPPELLAQGVDLEGRRPETRVRPHPVVGALAEGAVLVLLMLLGGLLVPRAAVGRSARPALALLVGIGLHGAVGAAIVGPMLLIVPPVVAVIGATTLRARGIDAGWSRADLQFVMTVGLVVLATSVLIRLNGWVVVSTDGVSYLIRGWAQAFGGDAAIGSHAPALSALHAVGFRAGADGLYALGPVALIAAIVLMAASVRTIVSRATDVPGPLATSLLGLLVLVSGAAAGVRFSSMLVHAHVLVAALALALVVLWSGQLRVSGASDVAATDAAAFAAATLAAGITLARPEGAIIPLAMLIGTVGSAHARTLWRAVAGATGLSLVLQFGLGQDGFAVLARALRGGSAVLERGSIGIAGLAALGALVLLAPVMIGRMPRVVLAWIPRASASLVWSGLIVGAMTGAFQLDASMRIARANVFEGAGGWGPFLPVLVLAGIFALTVLRPRSADTALSPAIAVTVGFVPLAFLSKALGDGVGRVHWHDSVTRIWMHLAFVVILLVIVATGEILTGTTGEHRPAVARYPRSSAALAVLALFWVASWWQPSLVSDDPVELELTVPVGPPVGASAPVSTRSPFLYLVDVDLPAAAALDDVDHVDVCSDIRFGTFERDGTASMTARLQLAGASREAIIDGSTVADNAVHRVCWPLGRPSDVAELLAAAPILALEVMAEEVGPAVLLAVDGSPDVRMLLRWEAPPRLSDDLVRILPGATAVLLASILIVSSRKNGATSRQGAPRERNRVSSAE